MNLVDKFRLGPFGKAKKKQDDDSFKIDQLKLD
jgi:hypothetical protein